MLNKIILMGRLVRDPELRSTNTGRAVASFTLAVDRDFKGQDGEKATDFVDVTAWGQTASFVSKYFTKGRMAVVEGRLESRKWVDRDGRNRVSWGVVANSVYFGDSQRDAVPASEGNAPEDAAPPPAEPDFKELDNDGELPF